LSAGGCTEEGPTPERPTDRQTPEYAAVYFLEGHGLAPEFRELPAGEPAAGLIELLNEGSSYEGRTNLVPAGTVALEVRAAEPDGVAVELGEVFWSLPEGERFAAAAQMVYTLGALEDGRNIVLMQGFVPGEIRDANGELLTQPLTRANFEELEPWVELLQPAPGAIVSGRFPLVVRQRVEGRVQATLHGDDGRVLSSVRTTTGEATMRVPGGTEGPLTLRVLAPITAGGVELEVPLSSAGGVDRP
jgi:hypothetical protein